MARWGMEPDPAKSPETWFFHLTPRNSGVLNSAHSLASDTS